MILGLNTATTRTYISLVQDGEIIDEKSWNAEQNESETMLPNLRKILEDNNLKWSNLDEIAVITGPGPFTALRISIAIANALGYGLGIKIVDIPVKDFWKFRIGDEFALYAGGNKIYYRGELINADKFLSQKRKIAGQLRKNHIEEIEKKGGKYINEVTLPTLGEFLIKNVDKYERKDIVKPRYFTKPHITVSKKQYK